MQSFEVEYWYRASDDSTSTALVLLDGCNPNGTSHNSEIDITYSMVMGEAVFCIDGVRHLIQQGESIVVKRGSRYSNLGNKATMLASSSPAFPMEQ
jgi:hypothetical protein